MKTLTEQSSKLCDYCRTHVFGRYAWAMLWGEPESDLQPSLKYTATREALLASLEEKCQFCNFLYVRSGNGGNVSIGVELQYPADVRPRKINALSLSMQGTLDQIGRIHYVGLFTKPGMAPFALFRFLESVAVDM